MTASASKFAKLARLLKELCVADCESAKYCAQSAANFGSSRAVTSTTHARWARAAEHRDKLLSEAATEAAAVFNLKECL